MSYPKKYATHFSLGQRSFGCFVCGCGKWRDTCFTAKYFVITLSRSAKSSTRIPKIAPTLPAVDAGTTGKKRIYDLLLVPLQYICVVKSQIYPNIAAAADPLPFGRTFP